MIHTYLYMNILGHIGLHRPTYKHAYTNAYIGDGVFLHTYASEVGPYTSKVYYRDLSNLWH